MRKIKNDIIKNSILKMKLTPTEIDFYIYISMIQFEDGTVPGIYYNDICNNLGIVKSTFYATMRSLKEKGLIEFEREDDISFDYRIKLLNNDFSDGNHRDYFSTSYKFFDTKEYKNLKANEKVMLFDLLINAISSLEHHGSEINLIDQKYFFQKYIDFFGLETPEKGALKSRTIREYKKSLKKFFFFKKVKSKDGKKYNIKIGFQKDFRKDIIKRKEEYEKANDTGSIPYDPVEDFPGDDTSTKEDKAFLDSHDKKYYEEMAKKVINSYINNKDTIINHFEEIKNKASDQKCITCHLVEKIMRINKIKDASKKDIVEVGKLFFQHKNDRPDLSFNDFYKEVLRAVTDTIFIMNSDKKKKKREWKRTLEPAFVHKQLMLNLNIQAA